MSELFWNVWWMISMRALGSRRFGAYRAVGVGHFVALQSLEGKLLVKNSHLFEGNERPPQSSVKKHYTVWNAEDLPVFQGPAEVFLSSFQTGSIRWTSDVGSPQLRLRRELAKSFWNFSVPSREEGFEER